MALSKDLNREELELSFKSGTHSASSDVEQRVSWGRKCLITTLSEMEIAMDVILPSRGSGLQRQRRAGRRWEENPVDVGRWNKSKVC